ncbi:MAG: hypothetical protein ACK4WC_15755 [Rubrimonas sp.]
MSLAIDLTLPRRAPAPLAPVCLGLMGLGLAWRKAAEVYGAPAIIGEAILAFAIALSAVVAIKYVSMIRLRPAALTLDLRKPAGRGAVPAGSETLIVGAAALLPYSYPAALAAWLVGVALHLTLAFQLLGLLRGALVKDPRPSGFLLVPFVGPIVAPIAGAEMDLIAPSKLLFWIGLGAYLVLFPLILRRFVTEPVEHVFRPSVFMLVAPPAIGIVAYEQIYPGGPLAPWMYAFSCLLLLGMATRRRWLTEGGFSATWGAFTFPFTAFAAGSMAMAGRHHDALFPVFGIVALMITSVLTPWIAARVLARWKDGTLVTL